MRFIAGLLLLIASAVSAQTFTASKTAGEFPIATSLTWDMPGAASCLAGGAGTAPAWSGLVPSSGTRSLSGINKDLTLTLSCTGPSGNSGALLSWTPPTTNTNGSPLTDLAGYRIFYSPIVNGGGPTLDRTLDVMVAGATSFQVSDLAAGEWAFAVSALTTDNRISEKSNIALKTVAGQVGQPMPVLSITIDGYTVPKPPVLTTVEVVAGLNMVPAYRISASGTRGTTVIGFVPVGTQCSGPAVFSYRGKKYHRVSREAVKWWGTAPTADAAAPCA